MDERCEHAGVNSWARASKLSGVKSGNGTRVRCTGEVTFDAAPFSPSFAALFLVPQLLSLRLWPCNNHKDKTL